MTQTPSDTVAANVREIRKRRGLTAAGLSERCRLAGGEGISVPVLQNIEYGRRRDGERTRHITVDEMLVLARALSVPPYALLPELGGDPGADVRVLLGLDSAEATLREVLDRVGQLKRRFAGT